MQTVHYLAKLLLSMESFWKRSTPAGPEVEPLSPKEDDNGERLKDKISKKVKGGASKAKRKTKHLAGKVKAAFSHGSGSQSGHSSHDSGDEVDPRTEEENLSDSHASAAATTPKSDLNDYHSMPSMPSSPSSMASKHSGVLHQNAQGDIEPPEKKDKTDEPALWQRTKEQFTDSHLPMPAGDAHLPHSEYIVSEGQVIPGSSPDKEMVVVLSSSVYDAEGEDVKDANASFKSAEEEQTGYDPGLKFGQEEEVEEALNNMASGQEKEMEKPVVLGQEEVVEGANKDVTSGREAEIVKPVPPTAALDVMLEAGEEPVALPALSPARPGEIEEEPTHLLAQMQVVPGSVLAGAELPLTSSVDILKKAMTDTGFFKDQSGKSALLWAYDTTKAPFCLVASTLTDMADHPEAAGPLASTSSTLMIWAYDTTAATFNWFMSPFGAGLPRPHKKPWRH